MRVGVLDVLDRAIGFDGAFFATVDPATLLYTSALRRAMPEGASPLFIAAELGSDDVNQLRYLARAAVPVGWLDAATRGERNRSARYRTAMAPFGLGDELRVALLAGGTCWGLLCLHRLGKEPAFQAADARMLARVARSLGAGLRRCLAAEVAAKNIDSDGPGVVIVATDGSVQHATPAGARWLDELQALDHPTTGLPTVVRAVTERLKASVEPALARVRAPSGAWLAVHAAPLGVGMGAIAVVIEPAGPVALSPLIMAAFGLTPREAEVCRRLLIGLARKTIAAELALSLHTVNDHVKAILDKTGVSSAGQLRAVVNAGGFVRHRA